MTFPSILYQDEDLIVLDKPVGMVVNRASSVKTQTVQDFLEQEVVFFHDLSLSKSQSDDPREADFINRTGIVHRIDKETSGILLIAKNFPAFIELQRQFKERLVQKTYLALVHGSVPKTGEINAPIGRLPWNREQFGVVPGGKEAYTKFMKLSEVQMPGDDGMQTISVVEVYPQTGRTHQIRVHFKYLGHPLLGDYLYAGRKQGRNDRKDGGRVMLHAKNIRFFHPKTHLPLAFEAPIPQDMNSIIHSGT